MFYYDGTKWVHFKNKIEYTKTITEYDNDTDRFRDEKDLKITPVQLTDEQLARLGDIRDKQGLGIGEITAYVITGEAATPLTQEAKEQATEKSEILEMISTAPPEILIKMKSIQRPWEIDRFYSKGELVIYVDTLYKVLQAHQSQSDWTPDKAVSLFAKVLTSEDGTPKEWVQPESTNPYMKGDRVLYQGKTYESTIDNNVWSPTAYPHGWKEVM